MQTTSWNRAPPSLHDENTYRTSPASWGLGAAIACVVPFPHVRERGAIAATPSTETWSPPGMVSTVTRKSFDSAENPRTSSLSWSPMNVIVDRSEPNALNREASIPP